jgi:L-cystine transport system substrate-binding protein
MHPFRRAATARRMTGDRSSGRPFPRCGVAVTALSCLAACSPYTGGDTLDAVRRSGLLRVALTETNPPWNFLRGGTRPAGYDVDVAHEVARRIHVAKVTFVGSDFAALIGGVRADKFDIVISGQTITARRREQVDFSRPYALNSVALFVRRGNDSIRRMQDLAGKRIGVSEGTVQAEFARTHIRDAQVKAYQNAILALTDLSWGRSDAVLVSRFQGTYLATRQGLAVVPAGPILHTYALSMSFRKGSPAFKHAVDDAIDAMIRDGTLSMISRRWLNGLDMAAELRRPPIDATPTT